MDQLLRFALNALRHFIQDIGGLMNPATLLGPLRVLIRNRSCFEKVGLHLQGLRFDPVTGERRAAFIEQRPKRLSDWHLG